MKISQLIDDIRNNDLVLPEFQREYVWSREQAKQLLVSLLKKSSVLFYHNRIGKKLKALLSLLPFLKRIREGSSLVNFIKSASRYFRK